ncbi:unnamed protein product [Nippostrongylus brasiliensis]|uniref:AGC-kinase C-terminal domain-containing protein n=1 Tax=Nippostrongylus brasiliensis TaxID=27835 RepID=A0A0N4YZJ2_NIPBR|nr:unnamed protein product [Nippostrongylus brasiliensis]
MIRVIGSDETTTNRHHYQSFENELTSIHPNIHPFMQISNWVSLIVEAPFLPKCRGPGDASNFDDYEEEPLRISGTEKCSKEFAEF